MAKAISEQVVKLQLKERSEKVCLAKKLDYYLVHPILGVAIMAALTLAAVWVTLILIHETAHHLPFLFYDNFYDPVRSAVNSVFPEGVIHNMLVGKELGIYSSLGILTIGVFFVVYKV